jgi:uncharacterized protein GlcG (DUF336 family)
MFWDHFRRSKRSRDPARPARKPPGRAGRALNFERLEDRSLMSIDGFAGGAYVAASGSADPQNDLIVTGAESGGGPHVRVFNANNDSASDPGINFFAYDASFRGGVRVAVGDVDLDGSNDIITAAGVGGGPHIRVFHQNGQPLAGPLGSFFAYNPAFTGGVYVAAGDVNGDGRADVITGAGAGGGPHVRVFDAATGTVIREFFAFAPNFTGGVRVAAGDVNGDTHADIIVAAGTSGGPHVRVFDGVTGAQLPGAIGSFFAYNPGFTGGVFVAAGDLNGDSRADIITGAGEGGGPHVRAFDAVTGANIYNSFAYEVQFTGGVRVAAANLDMDPQAEIVTAPGDKGSSRIRVFDSATGMVDPLQGLGNFNAYATANFPQLTPDEVDLLLKRAAGVSSTQDAIIAVVDRNGRILGVRVEQDVLNTITDPDKLVFAIDGAVAKARTAAFFANGDPTNGPDGTFGPLTSRTIRFISQSTITQREVESNPNSADPLERGPGFVAPIGLGGHFPPGIEHTPVVDLFGIEHTNRDSLVHPGDNLRRDSAGLVVDVNGIPVGGVDPADLLLPGRFNIDQNWVPAGQQLYTPESYGFVSGRMPEAQSRGIATLPGGIPLFRDTNGNAIGDTLIGGIGVFFPGPDGYATFEQGFVPGVDQSTIDRTNAPKVLESEFIALAAAGGSIGAGAQVSKIGTLPPVTGLDLPFGRIFLVGIDLETVGPHPQGVETVKAFAATLLPGDANSGADQPVDVSGTLHLEGRPVPAGWLVLPHDSPLGTLTAADVDRIINQGITEAGQVRAQIRLEAGNKTRMVLSVADTDGNVLGLYRMQDSTVFSIDVAVAKARNVAYYADPNALKPADQVDDDDNGVADLTKGIAFSNRTFRFLSEARYPSGVDFTIPGDFSSLRNPGINRFTAENEGATPTNPRGVRLPPEAYTTVLAFDAFFPGTNFHDDANRANQNGIVFFPGSLPLYKSGALVGGWGVSGDGVDQDDVVTFNGASGYLPPSTVLRADEVFVRGVRLPITNFPRNPHG